MVVVLFGEFEGELHGVIFACLFKVVSMKIGLNVCIGDILGDEEEEEEFSGILVNSLFLSKFSFFSSFNAGFAELAGLKAVSSL